MGAHTQQSLSVNAECGLGLHLSSTLSTGSMLDDVKKALATVIDEKFIDSWLSQPNAAFDGLTPLQLIERGEQERIHEMVYRLQSGVPS